MSMGLSLGRCLPLLILTSCILFFVFAPQYQSIHGEHHFGDVAPRQLLSQSDTNTASSQTPITTTSSPPSQVPSSTPTTTPDTTTTTTTSSTSTSSSPPPTSRTSDTGTTPTTTSTTSTPPSPTTPTGTPSQVETTNAQGQTITEITTVPFSASSSSSVASPSSSSSTDTGKSSGDSSSLSTGSIIGLSVAGGIALIGILAFVIWKFTRKRFSDKFDDNEAIKWPELNHDNHALPTNPTGGAGFSSEVSLTRGGSLNGGYAASIGTASQSQVDLYAADPYAVPPLPHLNPNQPQQYRDDPNAGGYYDPYPGPVPPTFLDNPGTHEVIPMTQIPPGSRARSPGPQLGLSGRESPSPSVGRQSPGPYGAMRGPVGYGGAPVPGRQSPGPNEAYGFNR